MASSVESVSSDESDDEPGGGVSTVSAGRTSNDSATQGSEGWNLTRLLETEFPNKRAALFALSRFMIEQESPLGEHTVKPTGNGGRCKRLRCNACVRPRCGFSLSLRWRKGGNATITWNQKPHRHASVRAVRMTKDVCGEILRRMDVCRRQGLSGFDSYNRVNVGMKEEAGVAREPSSISGLVRRQRTREIAQLRANESEEAQVQVARRGSGAPLFVPVAEGDAADLTSALAWVAKKYPNSYLRVVCEGFFVKQVTMILEPQRRVLSLFGETLTLDDTHAKTSSRYKVGGVAVLTNTGKVALGGVSIFANSDIPNWRQFVSDLANAAATTGGRPHRPWRYALADKEASIAAAVESVLRGSVSILSCQWHLRKLLTSKFARCFASWSAVLEQTLIMLTTDHPVRFQKARRRAGRLIDAIANIELRSILITFTHDIVNRRNLQNMQAITHTWNSQSAVESTFSVLKKVGMGPSRCVGDVVRSLAYYMENIGVRQRLAEAKDEAEDVMIPDELAETHVLLTRYAFDLFLEQYVASDQYTCKLDREACAYKVKNTKSKDQVHFREVHVEGGFSCSCNMLIYRGVPCRHLLSVIIASQGSFHYDARLFNTRWLKAQPPLSFAHGSPFTTESASTGSEGREDMTDSDEDIERDADEGLQPQQAYGRRRNSNVTDSDDDIERDADEGLQPQQVYVQRRPSNPRVAATPADRSQDLFHQAKSIIERVGHNPRLLESLTHHLDDFDQTQLDTQGRAAGRLSIQHAEPRQGQPETVRKGAGRTSKKQYKCGRCRKTGHTRNRCPLLTEERTREVLGDEDGSESSQDDSDEGVVPAPRVAARRVQQTPSE
eukprot:GHVU01048453.1.p1 GENE.GHVU01048453.1~~GHVU01048453.1.p1  ORF type:complete len:839 (+),score=64.98 GHVU01048453.1:406-2922(+)